MESKIENKVETSSTYSNPLQNIFEVRKFQVKSDYSQIKKSLVKLFLASTIHGLPKIFKSRRFIYKILWTLFFIMFFTLCVFICSRYVCEFLRKETVTKMEVIYENPSVFPTVTFCNLNNNCNGIEQMLIKCLFNGKSCDKNDFKKYEDSLYGKCWVFNNNKSNILFSKQPGKDKGLQLTLFIGASNSSLESKGVHVFIHNNSVHPKRYEGLDIPPGFQTNLVVRRIFEKKINLDNKKCINENKKGFDSFDSRLFDFIRNNNHSYRQKDCFDLCLSMEVIEKCQNCNLKLEQMDKVWKYCSKKMQRYQDIRPNNHEYQEPIYSSENDSCFTKIEEKFYKEFPSKKCLSLCPLECDTIDYQISFSMSSFPGVVIQKEIEKILKEKNSLNTLEKNDFKETILKFNVYYDELKYKLIREQQKSSELELFSNIGGILSLGLGVSLFSFVELIEIIFEILFSFYENTFFYKI